MGYNLCCLFWFICFFVFVCFFIWTVLVVCCDLFCCYVCTFVLVTNSLIRILDRCWLYRLFVKFVCCLCFDWMFACCLFGLTLWLRWFRFIDDYFVLGWILLFMLTLGCCFMLFCLSGFVAECLEQCLCLLCCWFCYVLFIDC